MNTGLNYSAFKLDGLFELDKTGKILYSRSRIKNRLLNLNPHLIGQNFFNEVADFDNIPDFQRFFNSFLTRTQLADNFVFDCRYDRQVVSIRVMMLRAYETNCIKPADIVILDIRKNN